MITYTALLIGCGKIAGNTKEAGVDTHAGALCSQNKIILSSCVDLDFDRAVKFAERYGCQAHRDVRSALLNKRFDVISICTSDKSHFILVKEILTNINPPKVLFLEKPACRTRNEFHELKVLAKKANVLILVNHTRRFSQKYAKLRSIIQKKEFGDLYQVNATYYGGWFHNGTHLVDTLNYILDDIIHFEEIRTCIPCKKKDDPSLEFKGHLKGQSSKVIFSVIDESIYQLFDLDLWFEHGRLRIENFGKRIIWEMMIINALGEKVLVPSKLDLPNEDKSEMQNAYMFISDFLRSKEDKHLNHISLEALEPTMEMLWQGESLNYKKNNHEA